MLLDLASIRTDGGTQMRVGTDPGHIVDLADDLRNGAKMPPPVVFFDGAAYWLVDGFHRIDAHRSLLHHEVECDVRNGSLEEAIDFAFTVNHEHGRRRTSADKRLVVERALTHPKWRTRSDREIARHCGVSDFLVRQSRVALRESRNSERAFTGEGAVGGYADEEPVTRKCADGRNYPAKRQPKAEPTPDSPEYWADKKGPPVPPISVPDPVIPPEPKPRPWAPEELNALVRDTLNACHDQHEILDALEKRVAENFAKVEPRFAIDLIQRCECAIAGLARRLANTAETISAHLPSDEPTRRFGVIKGGRT